MKGALVLTRRVGETIEIGDDITLMVTAIHGNQVRLGFKAPRNVPIIRSEIKQRKTEKV